MSHELFIEIRQQPISTSTFADLLDAYGVGEVLCRNIVSRNMQRHYFIGHAYTVEWERVRKTGDITRAQPSTWEQVKDFLVPDLSSARDLVYVAGAGALTTDAALAGGLSCTYFAKLGFEGIVLGGSVRDAAEVRALTTPVLASNFTPVDTQGAYRVRSTGKSCMIEGSRVTSGDVVVSDDNGTVVFPAPLLGELYEKALEIERIEGEILATLRNRHDHRSLASLVEERNRI
ncbi:RraA family protein [Pseudomonas aeruginosa]|uniref:RraA family protein n=1 Tax=Pseudomonas aeruginosa TaxID=287 RepID=UPI000710FE89|nr:RraA family protein [Pseudomonas aeruginosa]RUB22528.1 RraA family protein [Pseudomonas aeruginosa]HDQ4733682.1 RraA family protein [Pseudomonas aeruginosa]